MSQSCMPSEFGCLWGHKDGLDKPVLHLLLSSMQNVGKPYNKREGEDILPVSLSLLGQQEELKQCHCHREGQKNVNKMLREKLRHLICGAEYPYFLTHYSSCASSIDLQGNLCSPQTGPSARTLSLFILCLILSASLFLGRNTCQIPAFLASDKITAFQR